MTERYYEPELNLRNRVSPPKPELDEISVERATTLHPLIRLDVIKGMEFCVNAEVPIRIVQAGRSIEYQNELYAKGRATPGKVVTNAKGGYSWHNFFMAFDFCLLRGSKQISWSNSRVSYI